MKNALSDASHYVLALLTLLALLLAPLSQISATEPVVILADQEPKPTFSWDHVSLYMHIRKDTAYTDDEIRYLAKFPLITFEKGPLREVWFSGSVRDGIKPPF